ncbi:hypothetical protein IGK47_003673 [Enterococcus sp. AZ007]
MEADTNDKFGFYSYKDLKFKWIYGYFKTSNR